VLFSLIHVFAPLNLLMFHGLIPINVAFINRLLTTLCHVQNPVLFIKCSDLCFLCFIYAYLKQISIFLYLVLFLFTENMTFGSAI